VTETAVSPSTVPLAGTTASRWRFPALRRRQLLAQPPSRGAG
jgi:hypothetical protein